MPNGTLEQTTNRWAKYGRDEDEQESRWSKYGVSSRAEVTEPPETEPLTAERAGLLGAAVGGSMPEPGEMSVRQTALLDRSIEESAKPSFGKATTDFISQAGAGAADRALHLGERLATGLGHLASYPSPEMDLRSPSQDLERADFPEPSEGPIPQWLSETREEVAEYYGPPETGAGLAGRLTGAMGTEGLSYAVGGGAIRRGVGLGARTGGAVAEAVKDALAVAPIDIAITSGGAEESVAGALAPVVEEHGPERVGRYLQTIADDPVSRAAFETATGFGADVALRGLAAGVRGSGRLMHQGAEGVGRALVGDIEGRVGQGVREGVAGAEPRFERPVSPPYFYDNLPEPTPIRFRDPAPAPRPRGIERPEGELPTAVEAAERRANELRGRGGAEPTPLESPILDPATGRPVRGEPVPEPEIEVVGAPRPRDPATQAQRRASREALEPKKLPGPDQAGGPRIRSGEVGEPTTPDAEGRGAGDEGGVPEPDELVPESDAEPDPEIPRTTPEERAQVELRRRLDEIREAGDPMPGADRIGQMYRRILAAESRGGDATSRWDKYGAAQPGLVRGLAGAGAGGAAGAAVDEENRLRGAAAGAAIGAGVGAGAGALKRAASAGPSYLQNESVQRVLSTVGRDATPSGDAGFLSRLTSATGDAWRKTYTRIIDEAAPLKRLGREVEGSERLADEAARAKGYRGAVVNRIQEDFRPVVRLAEGHEEGVVALTKAERALELLDAGLVKTDLDRETLERTIRELSAVPEVREAANALQDYYRSLLERKFRNGVISEEQYLAILERGDSYIPFVREIEDGLATGSVQFTPDGRLKSGATGVRRMGEEQASSATVDPFEQAIRDTAETERRIAKQRVTNLTAEIVDENPEAAAELGLRFVSDAEAGRKGARVTPVNVGGERRWLEVADDEVWNAFASFDPYSANLFINILSKPKRWLREGVTALPDFGIANAIRDNVMTGLQYPFPVRGAATGTAVGAGAGAATAEEGERLQGAIRGGMMGLGIGTITPHLARTLDAMRDIVGPRLGGDPNLYREWLEEGGSGFGFYVRNTKDARRVIDRLKSDGVDPSDIVSPRHWWQALQSFNRVIEEAPRVARYKYLKDQGLDIPAAIAGSRDVSLDFSRIGAHMKGLSATNAFLNAQVQGWDKLARLLKDRRTWSTGAGLVTAPSVGLWMVNKENEEYWDRPLWERNLFWLVPKSGGGFWRIPKPFEVGFLFGSVPERLLDYLHQKDPEALRAGMGDMLNTYGVGSMLPLTTAATPIIENVADHSFFRGRPIDPYQFENLPPELQYSDRTSALAIGAGRLLGRSPAQIENILRGWGGSAMGEFLEASTRAAKMLGIDERPRQAETDPPLIGRFMTRETGITEREMSLRRKFDRAEKARNAVQQFIQNRELGKAREYVRENRDVLSQYERLKGANNALTEARRARQKIERSNMPPERKREAIRMINRAVGRISDAAVGGARRVRGRTPESDVQPTGTGN